MLKKVVLWVVVILTCLMIFNFSSKKGTNSYEQSKSISKKVENIVSGITDEEPSKTTMDNIHKVIRKQGHFIEFAFLGILVFLLTLSYDFSIKKSIIITLTFVLFYAITDEIHQLFVEGRSGRVIDVLIDFLGCVVGIALIYPFEKKKIKKQTKKS